MKIKLLSGVFGTYLLETVPPGRDHLIQGADDIISLASNLGWVGGNGFASDWLDDHLGTEFEDPGYFDD
jgi:hypothetical protein